MAHVKQVIKINDRTRYVGIFCIGIKTNKE